MRVLYIYSPVRDKRSEAGTRTVDDGKYGRRCLIETIQDWGVDVVFGLPGDGVNGIIEALRNEDKIVSFRCSMKNQRPWRAATRNIQARRHGAWRASKRVSGPHWKSSSLNYQMHLRRRFDQETGLALIDPGV